MADNRRYVKPELTEELVRPGIGEGVCFVGVEGRPRAAVVQDHGWGTTLALLVFPGPGETFNAYSGYQNQQMPYRQEWGVKHRDDPERKPYENWWIHADEARPVNAR